MDWILNLDAEFELEKPDRFQPNHSKKPWGVELEFARELLAPEDRVLTLQELAAGKARGRPVTAWCPTPSVVRACEQGGAELTGRIPVDILRRANSRGFCASLGQNLHGAHYFPRGTACAVVRRHLESSDHNWLLKREFGVAGRGARRIRARDFAHEDRSWILASTARGGVQVEPFLELVSELSLHGLLEEGDVRIGRPLLLAAGEPREAARAVPDGELSEERTVLRGALERVLDALRRLGYRGPVGIDAFQWRAADGALRFRALSEINARFTTAWARGMVAAS